jgi:hypothetical protein
LILAACAIGAIARIRKRNIRMERMYDSLIDDSPNVSVG